MPRVLAHSQDDLGLVNDDEQPFVAGHLHDFEHAAQVVQGVAAAARVSLMDKAVMAAYAVSRDTSSSDGRRSSQTGHPDD